MQRIAISPFGEIIVKTNHFTAASRLVVLKAKMKLFMTPNNFEIGTSRPGQLFLNFKIPDGNAPR